MATLQTESPTRASSLTVSAASFARCAIEHGSAYQVALCAGWDGRDHAERIAALLAEPAELPATDWEAGLFRSDCLLAELTSRLGIGSLDEQPA